MTTLSLQIPEKYDTQNIKRVLESLFQQNDDTVEDAILSLMMLETMDEETTAQDISVLKKKHGY